MKTNPHLKFKITLRWCLLAASFLPISSIFAQNAATGNVEGRVKDPSTGHYIELARVRVQGTSIETFSDAAGHYQLSNVPAGSVTLEAFCTGYAPQTLTVSVPGGQSVQQDIELASQGTPAGEVVEASEYVINATREMSGAAIAINTQRFAPNQVSVTSADEFGPIPFSNVGRVLDSMPGITLTQGGLGEPNTISVDGVPSEYVPVTLNGFNFAQANANTTRTIGIHQVSLNNISRVEVAYTPTPETPGSALAGTVNMVPRNAFEREKPLYTASASLLMRDTDLTFGKSPGGRRGPRHKIFAGFDLAAVVPLNKRLGFTLTAATSPAYTPLSLLQATWRGASAPTNGAAFPDTTPDKPYLTTFSVRDAVRFTRHTAYGATVDYRFSPNDTMTFTMNYALFDWESNDRQINFTINRVQPGDFGTNFTHSAPGGGALLQFDAAQDVNDTLIMPTLIFRHNGPVWKGEIGAGLSHSERLRRDLSHGMFANAIANRPNVTIWFDDIAHDGPRTITVKTQAGEVLDPLKLDTYNLLQATGNEIDTTDEQRSAFANIQRDLPFSVPVRLKLGLDVRQQRRDLRVDNPVFPFIGPDKDASQILDESYSQREAPFWFDRIQWLSNVEFADLYREHPEYFREPNEAARHNAFTAASKYAEETVSAGYIRGDVHLMNGRLKLVGGVRAEQTNVEGQGDLIDLTRNFQRDASGNVILGTDGEPLPISTDPVEVARLTHIERGLVAKKEYFRLFPSLNGSFNIRDNLIARAGYYRSIGRPDFAQYAGSLTLPNTENPPSPGNRIVVNNPAIKPWMADSFKASLEYYFERVGLVSVGGFYREIKNFFGPTVAEATPEFLAQYSLDPTTYGQYSVETEQNLPGIVHMSGLQVNYKQALTFLPDWARGLQVFANFTVQHARGEAAENVAGYIPRFGNWGISFSRPKYTLRIRWNYRDRSRQGPVAPGGSIEPGTFFWREARTSINASAEYQLTDRFTLFANFTDLNSAAFDTLVYGPSTPEIATFNGRLDYGAQYLAGIRAKF